MLGAVVLFVGVPWIAVDTGGDDWSAYAEERRLIADAIVAQGIDNLIVVAGDAHMLAADDGSNTNFSVTPGTRRQQLAPQSSGFEQVRRHRRFPEALRTQLAPAHYVLGGARAGRRGSVARCTGEPRPLARRG